MLMLIGESADKAHTMSSVARELSLSISIFDGSEPLSPLLRGDSRCIVFLNNDDVTDSSITALERSEGKIGFGIVICGDREALLINRPEVLTERINSLPNVEWVHDPSDIHGLCEAGRQCRDRLLRSSKAELQHAIENNELIIQYQPKVERGNDAEWIASEAEALIRWRHPQHGLLEPLEFLPELDVYGLIGEVSEQVLNDVAAQLVIWRGQGLELNACINLASSLLQDRSLPDAYEAIVKDHGLACENFTFEIVEQDVSNPEAPHLAVILALREKGFRISLDDFGVAVSSLGSFDQMPFDEIKIHGSVLSCARSNPVAEKVLAAVTGLAHNLGIAVCAEGVENEETHEFLKTIKCDKMQGFLISEAVMPDIIRRVYGNGANDVEDVA
jgi:EAL domain-containing protein (putative c-di-GMP-specific phosphodiesterase class I)